MYIIIRTNILYVYLCAKPYLRNRMKLGFIVCLWKSCSRVHLSTHVENCAVFHIFSSFDLCASKKYSEDIFIDIFLMPWRFEICPVDLENSWSFPSTYLTHISLSSHLTSRYIKSAVYTASLNNPRLHHLSASNIIWCYEFSEFVLVLCVCVHESRKLIICFISSECRLWC
jgi:hypothetical protein